MEKKINLALADKVTEFGHGILAAHANSACVACNSGLANEGPPRGFFAHVSTDLHKVAVRF